MHQLTRSCIKPDDNDGVILGSCDYIHQWGESGSIQDPKTSKFLSMESGELRYELLGQTSRVNKASISLRNDTDRGCISSSGNDVVIGSFVDVNKDNNEDTEYLFTILPGICYLFACHYL